MQNRHGRATYVPGARNQFLLVGVESGEGGCDMNSLSQNGVTAIVVLGLLLALHGASQIGAHSSIPLAGRAPHPFPTGSLRLYRSTAAQNTLQPIDRQSLVDRPGSVFHVGPPPAPNQDPAIVATANGSRFVVLNHLPTAHWPVRAGDLTLQLFDARTGKPLFPPHHPAVPFWITGISADGSVAYGFRDDDLNVPCASGHFYLLNVRTGRIIRQLTLAVRLWDSALVSPDLGRLYTTTTPDHMNGCGPRHSYHPLLTAYDLRTGRAVRSVQLKGVLGGRWLTTRMVNGERVAAIWQQGIALSPDGSQLAILDGNTNTLTLLRAQSLQIVSTETLSHPRTALETVAGVLGMAPDAAEAKGQDTGVELQMQYTADGRSLVVTGARLSPDRRHPYGSSRNLGIQLIDIGSGQLRAWLNDGKQVLSLWPAPDGSALYSSVQGWSRQGGWLNALRRHDPTTLRVVSRRTFPHMGNWYLHLVFLQAGH